MLAPGAKYIVKRASHSRLTALLLSVIASRPQKCTLNTCGFFWWQFLAINNRAIIFFNIAPSSFLPFQMFEILCSLVLNYSFFGGWRKMLCHRGLISLKRFELPTQFIKFYQSGRMLCNMWLPLKCSAIGQDLMEPKPIVELHAF